MRQAMRVDSNTQTRKAKRVQKKVVDGRLHETASAPDERENEPTAVRAVASDRTASEATAGCECTLAVSENSPMTAEITIGAAREVAAADARMKAEPGIETKTNQNSHWHSLSPWPWRIWVKTLVDSDERFGGRHSNPRPPQPPESMLTRCSSLQILASSSASLFRFLRSVASSVPTDVSPHQSGRLTTSECAPKAPAAQWMIHAMHRAAALVDADFDDVIDDTVMIQTETRPRQFH